MQFLYVTSRGSSHRQINSNTPAAATWRSRCLRPTLWWDADLHFFSSHPPIPSQWTQELLWFVARLIWIACEFECLRVCTGTQWSRVVYWRPIYNCVCGWETSYTIKNHQEWDSAHAVTQVRTYPAHEHSQHTLTTEIRSETCVCTYL